MLGGKRTCAWYWRARARKRLARELADSHAHPPAPRTRVPNGDLA